MRKHSTLAKLTVAMLVVGLPTVAMASPSYSTYRWSSNELERYALTHRGYFLAGYSPASLCRVMEQSFAHLDPRSYQQGYARSEGIAPYFQRSMTYASLAYSLYYFEQLRHGDLYHMACTSGHNPAALGHLQQTRRQMFDIGRLIRYENLRYVR